MNHVFSAAGLCMIIGLLIYLLTPPDRPDAKGPLWLRSRITEVGRIMFFCGLLTILLVVGRRAVLSVSGG